MTVLEQVLEEELERSIRLCAAMEDEMLSLPKGSVRTKMIRGRAYYYLTYREGDRVVSDYVRAEELDALSAKIERRRELKSALAEQKKNQRQLYRALGRKAPR